MRFPRKMRSVFRVLFARGAGSTLGMGIAVLIANRLGASAPADAFYLIRRLTLGLTEAARLLLVTVYVPPIVAMLRANRHDSLRQSMGRQGIRILGAASALAIAIAVLAPWLVVVLAPGFDSEREQLATALLRILIFAVPVHILFATLTSILYALRQFSFPEFAALLPRLVTILVLFFLVPPLQVTALGWSLLAGTLLGLALLVPPVRLALRSEMLGNGPAMVIERVDAELPPSDSEMPEFGKRVLPALVLQAYRQGSGWIDFAFASTVMAGAVAMIEYGQRLASVLPSMLIGSFFTVFYTYMAHDIVEGGTKRLSQNVAASMRIGMFLLVPFATFLWVAADLLVDIVFQHGAFDRETARLTTIVIRISALAFIITFATRALVLGAYADKEAPHFRIVAWMVGVGLATRIILLSTLPLYLGLAGILVAAVMTGILTASIAYYFLKLRWGGIVQVSDLLALGKIILAAAICWFGMSAVAAAVEVSTSLGQVALVITLAATGGALYLAATWILGVEEAMKLRAVLFHRPPSPS